MRKSCKRCGSNPVKPSDKVGARSVYCPPCDREMARKRMKALRLRKKAEQINKSYYKPKQGYVYIITNPNFNGWIKVGCALNAEDRLKSFQTGSPYRDYELKWSTWSEDKLDTESKAHEELSKHGERRNEWFNMPVHKAIEYIERL